MKDDNNNSDERVELNGETSSEPELGKTNTEAPISASDSLDDSEQKVNEPDSFDSSQNSNASRTILHQCLYDSFKNSDDAYQFCFYNCLEISKDIDEGLTTSKYIPKIIGYYDFHDAFDILWKVIKERNEKNYNRYYSLWKAKHEEEKYKAENNSAINEEIEFSDENLFDPSQVSRDSLDRTEDGVEHALETGNHSAITKWFFNELNPNDQSMLLATALFEGLNRYDLYELSSSLEEILSLKSQLKKENKLEDASKLEQEDTPEKIAIKALASFITKQEETNQEKENSIPKNNNKFRENHLSFERLGIISIFVKRNSEHGLTQIKSFGFSDEKHRTYILKLLDEPNLFRDIPKLYDFIYALGDNINYEIRHFAALAAIKLLETQPFSDIKTSIILPWVLNGFGGRQAASIVLVKLVENDTHKDDTLSLIKHWASSVNNYRLADMALKIFHIKAYLYPVDALNTIGRVLSNTSINNNPFIVREISKLFAKIYSLDSSLAIKRLHSWMLPVSTTQQCWIAGILLLKYLKVKDFSGIYDNRKMAAEMTVSLWSNSKFPISETMQEQTALKVKYWAQEVLFSWENETLEMQENCRTFFYELYQSYEGMRRNRLDYYLRHWQKQMEKEHLRKSRRRNSSEQNTLPAISYLDLIPEKG